jgi:uncharacterized protein (DUF1501 family)
VAAGAAAASGAAAGVVSVGLTSSVVVDVAATESAFEPLSLLNRPLSLAFTLSSASGAGDEVRRKTCQLLDFLA